MIDPIKTKFPKLRRSYTVAAIGCPILFFMAFLCYAYAGGWNRWAVIFGLPALILAILFPFRVVTNSPPSLKSKILSWLNCIAIYLCFLAGDFSGWIQKLEAAQAFWDWRFITAAGIWTALAIYKNLLFINELSDETIFNYLNRADSKKAD